MAKLGLVSCFILFQMIGYSQQILNSSFEFWTDLEPDNWKTNNFIIDNFPNILAVTQSSEAYAGDSAARLEMLMHTVNNTDRVYPPILFTNYFPVSEKVLSFKGFFQFHPQTINDSLSILVLLKEGTMAIGSALHHQKETLSSYTELTIPFFYFLPDRSPDSASISISINGSENSSLNSVGSYALIDNLSFDVIATDVKVNSNEFLSEFDIKQNYPNPFNPATKIKYIVPNIESNHSLIQHVTLKVYDILGNEAALLVNEEKSPGEYEIEFNAANLSDRYNFASGIYIARIVAGNFSKSLKMTLLK